MDYMKMALKEAKKSLKYNDVPVGCVIVKNNKIISKSYNKREKNNKITNHAEVNAIETAAKKLKTWHLDDCTLYTTLEPCLMCCSVILQSRIKKVVYALNNDKNTFNIEQLKKIDENAKRIIFEKENYSSESLELLQKFFQKQR